MSIQPTPSSLDAFLDAVCSSATPVAECDWCGRTNYNLTGEDMEEGEVESLVEKQRLIPEMYQGHVQCISYGYLLGKRLVYQCRCDQSTKAASDLLQDRATLIEAFRRVQEVEEKAVEQTRIALDRLNGSPERENPLLPYHGEIEILYGSSISEEQLLRFADSWKRKGQTPKWMGADCSLAEKCLKVLGVEISGS